MPWAAGMNSWLRRYGMRRVTSWSAAPATTTKCSEQCEMTRESAPVKPSIVSDVEMAWLLADSAGKCLTGQERTMTFVELGCREYLLAIKRILNAVPSCPIVLSERLFDALSRWLDGYAGSPEEPQLRTLLAEIRARQLEPVPLRTRQAQCGNAGSVATPVHSVAR